MSVKVDLGELSGQLDAYRFGYLITVSEDLRAHTVAVHPVLADGVVRVDRLGRRTRENLVARPAVSLVWPPYEEGGYTLIVDARATVTEDGADLEPEHAVLHRPAEPSDAAGGSAGEATATSGCGQSSVIRRSG